MPQFDFTNFPSQIFWMLLCFSVLYYFVSKIILPRIHDILADRRNIISQNSTDSAILQKQIKELQEKTATIRQEANVQYQEKIENALKASAKEREITIESLKTKLDKIAKDSNHKVESFIVDSMARSGATISSIAKSIKEKILS